MGLEVKTEENEKRAGCEGSCQMNQFVWNRGPKTSEAVKKER